MSDRNSPVRCSAQWPSLDDLVAEESLALHSARLRSRDGGCVFHAYSRSETLQLLRGRWTIYMGGSDSGFMFLRLLNSLLSPDGDSSLLDGGYKLADGTIISQPVFAHGVKGEVFDTIDTYWNDAGEMVFMNVTNLVCRQCNWTHTPRTRKAFVSVLHNTTRVTRHNCRSWYCVSRFTEMLLSHLKHAPHVSMPISLVIGPSMGRWYVMCGTKGVPYCDKKSFPAAMDRKRRNKLSDMLNDAILELSDFINMTREVSYSTRVHQTIVLAPKDGGNLPGSSIDTLLFKELHSPPSVVVLKYKEIHNSCFGHMDGVGAYLHNIAALNMMSSADSLWNASLDKQLVGTFSYAPNCTTEALINYVRGRKDVYTLMHVPKHCVISSATEMPITVTTAPVQPVFATSKEPINKPYVYDAGHSANIAPTASIGMPPVDAHCVLSYGLILLAVGAVCVIASAAHSYYKRHRNETVLKSNQANIITSLNFCRYIASIHVVAGHLYNRGYSVIPSHLDGALFSALRRALPWGYTWVPFFFILSGFVLTTAALDRSAAPNKGPLASEPDAEVSYQARLSFVWQRLRSIYPMYAVGLVLAYALHVYENRAAVSTSTLFAEVSLMQAWLPSVVESTLQPHCWFLSCQMLYWFLFKDMYRWVERSSARHLALALVACAVLIPWVGLVALPASLGLPTNWYMGFHSQGRLAGWTDVAIICLKFHPFCYLHVFVSGMLLARLHRELGRDAGSWDLSWLWRHGMVVGYGVLGAVFMFPSLRPYGAKLSCRLGLLAPLHCLILVGSAGGSDVLEGLFSWWPLRLLGEWSYAQYILQFIVFNVLSGYLTCDVAASKASLSHARVDYDVLLLLAVLVGSSAFCATYIQEPAAKRFHLLPRVALPVAAVWFIASSLYRPFDLGATVAATRGNAAFVSLPFGSVDMRLNVSVEQFAGSERYHVINPSLVRHEGGYIIAARIHYLQTLRETDDVQIAHVGLEYRFHSTIVVGALSGTLQPLSPLRLAPTVSASVPASSAEEASNDDAALDPLRDAPCRRPPVYVPQNRSYLSVVTTGPEDPRLSLVGGDLVMTFFSFRPVRIPGEYCSASASQLPMGLPYMMRYKISSQAATADHHLASNDMASSGKGDGLQFSAAQFAAPLVDSLDAKYVKQSAIGSRPIEKNWLYFQSGGLSYVIYSLEPYQVLPFTVASKKGKRAVSPNLQGDNGPLALIIDQYCHDAAGSDLCLHGSANPVLTSIASPNRRIQYYLGCFHVIDRGGVYRHFFYTFEKSPPFSIKRVSGEIPLQSVTGRAFISSLELTASSSGTAAGTAEGVVVAYGADDAESRVLMLSRQHIQALFDSY